MAQGSGIPEVETGDLPQVHRPAVLTRGNEQAELPQTRQGTDIVFRKFSLFSDL